ncbi:hypothetical protein OHS70_22030 [Streptomyces sp. NBC_00390]|uniref:hypothetical protein n=1 Tax=Streptomyces sp. NBC_00390 TaxID=2975736 RepID=UPI002E1E4C23
MTSHEYRERAEKLLTFKDDFHKVPEENLTQAAVWAQLATAAAIVEAAAKEAE